MKRTDIFLTALLLAFVFAVIYKLSALILLIVVALLAGGLS